MGNIVCVQRHIEQVIDGVKYKGHVKMAGVQFYYELEFGVPLSSFVPPKTPMTMDELRNLYRISLKRGGVNVELTDEEYSYFLNVLVQFAADLYECPQSRRLNEGAMGNDLRGVGPMAKFGASVCLCSTDQITAEFSPELCEVLSAPKFGCVISD